MPYDQLFKELLRAFFHEFMELFFPDVAVRLDFGRVRFLDKEVFTDLPEGRQREADNIIEVYTLKGEPEILLIHIETEAERRNEFPYRMFEYYMLLRLRFRLPVFPVAIYLSPGAGGLTKEMYTEGPFAQEVIRYSYAVVGMPDLSADDYQTSDNPLAASLSAFMRVSRLGRAVQKLLSLRQVAVSDLDEARKTLLTYVIQTYLPLSEAEDNEFRTLLAQPESQEVRTMVNIYSGRIFDEGVERGIEQGILQGQRNTLFKLLHSKFGTLPESVAAKIEAIESEAELDILLERILTANSLEEMGIR